MVSRVRREQEEDSDREGPQRAKRGRERLSVGLAHEGERKRARETKGRERIRGSVGTQVWLSRGFSRVCAPLLCQQQQIRRTLVFPRVRKCSLSLSGLSSSSLVRTHSRTRCYSPRIRCSDIHTRRRNVYTCICMCDTQHWICTLYALCSPRKCITYVCTLRRNVVR